MSTADEAVWKALANPLRRRILDEIRDRPRTTGELAETLGGALSRFAVMQHLDVLVEAGLVVVRREGRHRFNHLNAVPLQRIHERWVSEYAEHGARAALALKRHVEKGKVMQPEARTIRLESEIRIEAPPERVFRAFTDEQTDWYPHSYGGARLKAIVFEHRVGGQCYEDWGDGAGHLYSTVVHYDPSKSIGLRGHLSPGITLEQWANFEPDGDGTIVKHSTVTFGPITDEMAEAIRTHGDLTLFAERLKAWCEQGVRAGA